MNEIMEPFKLEHNIWMFRMYIFIPKTQQWRAEIWVESFDGKDYTDVEKYISFLNDLESIRTNTKEMLHEEINRCYNLVFHKS